MKHAREDYNRFQDSAGLIPEDEPVFLIRGQDISGPETLEQYAIIAQENGAIPEIVRVVQDHAEAMREWQKTHTAKIGLILFRDLLILLVRY